MLSSILNRPKGAPRNSNPVDASSSSSFPPQTANSAAIVTPVQDAALAQAKTAFLNQSLETLHEVFPGVDIEEVRRLLATTSEESRLYVVTEILLKSRRGRAAGSATRPGPALAPWEKFRTDEYQKAVQKALNKEFRGLSKATIQAVLAEHNFQYSRCRETLSEIASKSWRFSLSNLFRRTPRAEDLPNARQMPTGSKELDDELFELGRPAREAQIEGDRKIAALLNEAEYAAASALFECECCFGDYAWEETVACSVGHFFCHTCLRRSVQESVFGQGKSLLPEKASVACLSSTAQPPCQEFVPADVLRAVLPEDVYHSLEDRTASESLEKSGLQLVRCPFCGYAEVDELQPYRIRRPVAALGGLLVGTIFFLLPYGKQVFLLLLIATFTFPVSPTPHLEKTLRNIALRRRGTLFRCENTRCKRESCITCGKEWMPFHKCYEKEEDAARIFVEKAMADAVKRTCPLCHLSFVKSDGCNKLTCPCGYVMCYICRADIRTVGYKHFCQHFRQIPGTACTDCDACDLYANEDEAAAIKNAAKRAEEEYWSRCKKPKGMRWKGVHAPGEGVVGAAGGGGWWWGVEEVWEWVLECAVVWV